MQRRRDRLHHAQALSSALLFAAACAFGPARADVQKITADGVVHRVDVDTIVTTKGTGTAIRYTRQSPSGGHVSSWVPGTDDAAIDRDPVLEVEPATGRPVLVWSRNAGAGFDLYISRLESGAWTSPRALVQSCGDDGLPQIRYDDRYLHVAWRQQDPGGAIGFYRSSFDPATWAAAYGPEHVTTDDPAPVPPGGSNSSSPVVPATSMSYFCGTLPGALPGDPARSVVWGVRDEPVPISYRQVFLLPAEVTSVTSEEAAWIGGRFTHWFVSGARAYYAVMTATGWSSTRIVELNAQTGPADARAQIRDLNKGTGPQ